MPHWAPQEKVPTPFPTNSQSSHFHSPEPLTANPRPLPTMEHPLHTPLPLLTAMQVSFPIQRVLEIYDLVVLAPASLTIPVLLATKVLFSTTKAAFEEIVIPPAHCETVAFLTMSPPAWA